MKLQAEIKDGKFYYSYEVGASKHNASMELDATDLILFSNLLQQCSTHYKHRDKEWERDLMAKAWIEKQKEKQ